MTAPDRLGADVVLERHELLWVVEQCGGDVWPYPLRRPDWDAETEEETARHRRGVEDGLAGRGLLEPDRAALLLAVGELVRDWTLAVDLVHRSASAPRAAVALATDGRAALLVSTAHADAPVRVVPIGSVAPDGLAGAVLATVPDVPPGSGPALAVPVEALADPGAADAPTTRRLADARRAVARLVDDATGWAQLGVAVRAGGLPVRPARPVTWLDGPHGRHRVVHDRRGGSARAVVSPADAAGLVADAVVGVPTTAGPSGRSAG